MQHVLRGALGAALVYPAVWYGLLPEGAEPTRGAPSGAVAASAGASAPAPSAPARPAEPALSEPTRSPTSVSSQRVETARPSMEEFPAVFGMPVEPALPGMPAVGEPSVPSPVFSDVREALGQMSELQANAHDPNELIRRVQTMEQDPQKLARLKALAEMFVQLPPSRLEPYMPTREGGEVSRGSR